MSLSSNDLMHVDGGRVAATDGATTDVVNPATGAVIATVPAAGASDVDGAVAAARRAFGTWSRTTPGQRAEMLLALADAVLADIDALADLELRNVGKPAAAAHGEISSAADRLRFFAGAARCLEGRAAGEYLAGYTSMTRREPIGVAGLITPWNYPLLMAVTKLSPALAAGNTVVLKPSEQTPLTTLRLAALAADIFPRGVFNVVTGDGPVAGAALVRHPGVDIVSLTGDSATGKDVARAAADLLKRVHLELGGNSAMIILDDVDLEKAASVGAWGSFVHGGQICMATSRHIVAANIAADYTAALAEHANHLPVGDPAGDNVAIGPIIDEKQRDNIHRIVTSSVDAGARLAAGGTYEGLFYRPTVLADVPLTAPAYAEEIFGPVAPVVAFSSAEEAVRLAADTEYGLSLGILTRDVMKGLALADQIPIGLVHINDQTVNDEAVIPFGGVSESGNGARAGGMQANLDAYTDTQWVTMRGELPEYPF